ncbi:MAG TPA: protein kinase, partial [Polyangiales bacterium]
AKVVDFGISKLTDEQQGAGPVTRTGLTMGTPAYMSIEHMHGAKDVDARTDVYSFGVLLYRVLTGRLPFDGETFAGVAVQVATHQPPSPKQWEPSLPSYLDRLVMKAMARSRNDRFESLGALIEALAPLASTEGYLGVMTQPGGAVPRIAGTALEHEGTRELIESTRKLEQPPAVSAPMSTAPPLRTRERRTLAWRLSAALATLGLLGWLGVRAVAPEARRAPPVPAPPDAAAARADDLPLPVIPPSAPGPAPAVVSNPEWEAPAPKASARTLGDETRELAPAPATPVPDAGARRAAAPPARRAASRDAGLEAPPAKAVEPRVAPRSAKIQLDQF